MAINFCYLCQLFFVLLFITQHVQAQEKTFTSTVRLLDAVSLKPIAGAHNLGPRQQSTSCEDGHFQIQVESFTTLKVTHVSHESRVLETEGRKVDTNGCLNDIKWDFTKFLIDKDGNCVKRFAPSTKPDQIDLYVKKLL